MLMAISARLTNEQAEAFGRAMLMERDKLESYGKIPLWAQYEPTGYGGDTFAQTRAMPAELKAYKGFNRYAKGILVARTRSARILTLCFYDGKEKSVWFESDLGSSDVFAAEILYCLREIGAVEVKAQIAKSGREVVGLEEAERYLWPVELTEELLNQSPDFEWAEGMHVEVPEGFPAVTFDVAINIAAVSAKMTVCGTEYVL